MSATSGLQSAIETISANANRLRDAGIERIVVFGSVARGEDRADSDVDLLLVPRSDIVVGGLKLAEWRNLLTEILGRDADAVVEEFLKDHIKASVKAEGVEVFHA